MSKRKQYVKNLNNHDIKKILSLADHGFSAKAISRDLRIPTDSVYYICYKHDVYLRDYRDRENRVGRRVFATIVSKQRIRRVG